MSLQLRCTVRSRVLMSLQSCPTLCHPKDYIAHWAPLSMGILQTRTLEWVAMPFSRGSSQSRDLTHFCFAGSLLHWQAGSLSFTIPLFNTSSLLHHLYLILLKHFSSRQLGTFCLYNPPLYMHRSWDQHVLISGRDIRKHSSQFLQYIDLGIEAKGLSNFDQIVQPVGIHQGLSLRIWISQCF